MIMVVHTNKNGKLEFKVCEDMETAKRLFPNDQKQIVQCYNCLKTGDTVRVINESFTTYGLIGIIESIADDKIKVKFPTPIIADVIDVGSFLESDLKKVRANNE